MKKREYFSCGRKTRYRDEHEAHKIIRRSQSQRPHTHLRAYHCKYCNGWHITHSHYSEHKP